MAPAPVDYVAEGLRQDVCVDVRAAIEPMSDDPPTFSHKGPSPGGPTLGTAEHTLTRILTSGILTGLFVAASMMMWPLHPNARFTPLVVSLGGAVLGVLEMLRGAHALLSTGSGRRRGETPAPCPGFAAGEKDDPWAADSADAQDAPEGLWTRVLKAGTTWLFVLLALFLLFGTRLSAPLFTFLYLRLQARTPWLKSILATGLVYLFVILGFVNFLGLPVHRGYLWTLLPW